MRLPPCIEIVPAHHGTYVGSGREILFGFRLSKELSDELIDVRNKHLQTPTSGTSELLAEVNAVFRRHIKATM